MSTRIPSSSLGTARRSAAVMLAACVATASCGSSDASPPHPAGKAGAGVGGSGSAGKSSAGATSDAGESVGGTDSARAGRSGRGGRGGGGGSDANAGETTVAAGAGDGENAGSGGALDDGSGLRGRVVELNTLRPLAGRTVVVRSVLSGMSVQTTTNTRGEFRLAQPEGLYDAAVVEADGSAVSVYEGLETARPVLPHRWAGGLPTPAHLARISGNLSGGTDYPLSDGRDVVAVHLFTDQSSDRYLIGAGGPPYGPDYTTRARFDASKATATLLALGTFGKKDDADPEAPAYAAFVAERTYTLSDGDELGEDLELEPATLASVSGAVTLPDGRALTGMRERYRFPFPEALVDFPAADYVRKNPLTNDGAFEFELPEITAPGASLCLGALSEEDGDLITERCGIELGRTAVALELVAPPVLSAPAASSVVDANTVFSWSPGVDAVVDLELWPETPSVITPAISVFTTGAQAKLPDLEALMIFAPDAASYSARVTSFGPYGSIDAALGENGIGALVPAEARRSSSPAVALTLDP